MQNLYILTILLQALMPFIILIIMFRRRIGAIKAKAVSFKYYKTYHGENTQPEAAIAAERHFTNQFEVPTLFFAISLLTLGLGEVDEIMVTLNGLFVAFRLMHSFIHLGGNNVIHRMYLFGLSCLVLFIHIIYLGGKIFL